MNALAFNFARALVKVLFLGVSEGAAPNAASQNRSISNFIAARKFQKIIQQRMENVSDRFRVKSDLLTRCLAIKLSLVRVARKIPTNVSI